ncbi:MAG: flagellar biosynthetic protein FliO [Opitutae bacterium]|nr:flagellar biosynthetic protein FliO [Opitutae bacterium]
MLLLPGAFAQTKAPETPEVIYPRAAAAPPAAASNPFSGYNAALLTAIVLGAVGGWLFWRARTAPGGAALPRQLSIVETRSLGNRQYLVVAGYEDKKFLLGVCPGRIDLLTPLAGRPPAGDSS